MYLSQARLCLSRYQRRHCGHTEIYIFELRYFRNVSELFQPHDPSFPKNKKVSRLSRNCGISIICSESSEPSELETHAFGRTHQPGSSSPLELLLWSPLIISEEIVFVLVEDIARSVVPIEGNYYSSRKYLLSTWGIDSKKSYIHPLD